MQKKETFTFRNRKKNKKILQKTSYASIEYSNIEQKYASMLIKKQMQILGSRNIQCKCEKHY